VDLLSSNTPNLDLLKKNPVTDGDDTFNIDTMLNDNWDKIDAAVGEMKDELDNISIPDASLTQKGVVQLSSAINSTAEDRAATPAAVKQAYDAAQLAFIAGNERKVDVVAALVAIGVTATTSDTWPQLIAKISAVIRATGDAAVGDVREGKIFSTAAGNNKTGTLTVRATSAVTVTPSQSAQVLNPGIYDNTITIPAVTFDAAAVLTGTSIAGKAGTMPNWAGSNPAAVGYRKSGVAGRLHVTPPSGRFDGAAETYVDSADFVPTNVLAGKTPFGMAGTMPNRANDQQATAIWTDGAGNLSLGFPTGGYVTSSGFGAGIASVAKSDTDFVASNIRSGVNIFGVTGTLAPRQYASGTAVINTNYISFAYRLYGNSTIQAALMQYIEISGLGFTPTIVKITQATYQFSCTYMLNHAQYGTCIIANDYIFLAASWGSNVLIGPNLRLPGSSGLGNHTVSWEAWV
jgi:hypothetical protein